MVSGIGAIGGNSYSNYNISTSNTALDELIKKYTAQGYSPEEALQKAQAELKSQSTSQVEEPAQSQGVSSYGVSRGSVSDGMGLQPFGSQGSYVGQDQLASLNKFFLLGMQ